MVTVGSAIGATIPTTFGQTKCNVLIDTGAMKSCMSQAYYQQLMLPATRSIHSFSIKSANGTNLSPIGITECEFKIGTKEYINDFIVCKNLVWPCILGTDFLRKHGIWTGWSPSGKISANFSTKVSCGIIRGSNEGTHDSQQTRDKYPRKKSSCGQCLT